jgi:hypothetical protein
LYICIIKFKKPIARLSATTTMESESQYKYPIGDFLSGFSEDPQNPCDYELECQRMVIRGVEYLDKNPDLFQLISQGGVTISSEVVQPMISFMCLHEENSEESGGQTGAMVGHTLKVAYLAKKLGWNEYIQKITTE